MDQKSAYRIILEDRSWGIDIQHQPGQLPQIIERNGEHLIVRMGNQNLKAQIIAADHFLKRYEIGINGRHFTLQLQTPLDVMIQEMGLNRTSRKASNALIAPMPGMVLEIKTREGEVVPEGESLLILEAMKMENVLKSAAPTTIKKILVEKGQPVEKGQALIEFE